MVSLNEKGQRVGGVMVATMSKVKHSVLMVFKGVCASSSASVVVASASNKMMNVDGG